MRSAVFLATLATAALAACGGPLRQPLPLRPEPIAWVDTLPIPEPAEREPTEVARLVDEAVVGEVSRVISVRHALGEVHEALNVTRFDDVVPSAWFVHRNGTGRLTPAEVFRGPVTNAGPDTSRTLTVIEGKARGISPGFTIRDARGDRYVIKFDPQGFLHLSSGAGVISNRLLHAAGYHVPEDHIVVFDSARLAVDPEAGITGEDEVERPMTRDDLRAVLALAEPLPDGRWLAVASRFVSGIPKGPFYFEGVRRDDPNDHYHHEYRRELRGLYVVSSWINHVDMRFANTLDAYVAPGYLRHYLIDFAATLGSGTIRPHRPREGREYNFDLWPTLARVFTLGFWTSGWEDRPFEVIHPSIGWMRGEDFDPGGWKANWPNPAFVNMTDRDAYWGARLVGSFDDAQIEAAVRAGRLPDRAAADTLAALLRVRRDRIVDHWYRKVTPLESPAVEPAASGGGPAAGAAGTGGVRGSTVPAASSGAGFRLAFEDLGIRDGAWTADDVEYAWELEVEAEGVREAGRNPARPGSRQAIDVELGPEARTGAGRAEAEANGAAAEPSEAGSRDPAPGARSAFARLRVRAVRPGEDPPAGRAAVVWLERDAAAGWRVVGLEH